MRPIIMRPLFTDRIAAGRALARKLATVLPERRNVVVFGLARGGIPVAAEVAAHLRLPLDVIVVRKLGVPWQPELAMGALASGNVIVRNEGVIAQLAHAEQLLAEVLRDESEELARREHLYLKGRAPRPIANKTTIVVDDGIATGATMRAAVMALRERGARRVIAAAPHASSEACAELRALADDCICCATPEPYMAVGAWYEDFPQTLDEEVQAILVANDELMRHR